MPPRVACIFCAAILIGMAVSCASSRQDSTPVPAYVHAEVNLVEVDDSEPLLYASLLNHPHVFDLDALESLMRSVYFSPLENQNWKKPKRPIFPEKTARQVAPHMRKAFRTAKAYQKIQFRIQTDRGVTAGDTFIKDGALHWRFRLIEGSPLFDDFYNPYQWDAEASWPMNWVLRPQEGQRYYTSGLVGNLTAKKNWLVVDLASTVAGETAARQAGGEDETLVGRLERLRELKEAELISDEDYRSKVRSLLEEKNATSADPKDRLHFLNELRGEGSISEVEYRQQVQEALEHL